MKGTLRQREEQHHDRAAAGAQPDRQDDRNHAFQVPRLAQILRRRQMRVIVAMVMMAVIMGMHMDRAEGTPEKPGANACDQQIACTFDHRHDVGRGTLGHAQQDGQDADQQDCRHGLRKGRELLLDIVDIGLPTSTEALDPISPQYMQDIISWSAIGARTTESQTHREMSSGLSSAVGFKNGTDGGLTVAVNAMQSVSNPHRFLGINGKGQVSVVETTGNLYGHLVLRGGSNGPNYDSVHVAQCEHALLDGGVTNNIMIDCSHANSNKDPNVQPLVMKDVTHQIMEGNQSIIGVMVESNINAGNQSIPKDLIELKYGVSVTDACIDWATTEIAILEMTDKLRDVLPTRTS